MITIKTPEEITILREGGKRLAEIVAQVASHVEPGITTKHLDEIAAGLIRKNNDVAAFLNYQPDGAPAPYPATLCTSPNEIIVHGIPNDEPLKEGDILSIDCGVRHGRLFTDHAITVPVGLIDPESQELIKNTKRSLEIGIDAADAGATTGDIGYAIERFVGGRYGIVRELAGHGVGYQVHEEPYVPNYGDPGYGALLRPGMVLAVEPMLLLGGEEIIFEKDGYTVRTEDRARSAHFEHTIVITEDGPEILTQRS